MYPFQHSDGDQFRFDKRAAQRAVQHGKHVPVAFDGAYVIQAGFLQRPLIAPAHEKGRGAASFQYQYAVLHRSGEIVLVHPVDNQRRVPVLPARVQRVKQRLYPPDRLFLWQFFHVHIPCKPCIIIYFFHYIIRAQSSGKVFILIYTKMVDNSKLCV